jgi:hypothetical protein
VDIKTNGAYLKNIELRKIAYWDGENKRCFEFITKLNGMNEMHITLTYKKRWQIEILFKQLNKTSLLNSSLETMKMPSKYRSGMN